MTRLDLLWKKWSHIDKDTHRFVLNEDAPEEAKESYMHYCEQINEIHKRTKRCFIVYKSAEGEKWCEENYFDTRRTHETEYYILYDIPYDEFCVLEDIEDIDDLIDEYESKRLSLSKIKRYVERIEKDAPDLHGIINILNMAIKYETRVDFCEGHSI